jgi:hypothetical protein
VWFWQGWSDFSPLSIFIGLPALPVFFDVGILVLTDDIGKE